MLVAHILESTVSLIKGTREEVPTTKQGIFLNLSPFDSFSPYVQTLMVFQAGSQRANG